MTSEFLLGVLRALLKRTAWSEDEYCVHCGGHAEDGHTSDCPYERAQMLLYRIEAAGDEHWLPF